MLINVREYVNPTFLVHYTAKYKTCNGLNKNGEFRSHPCLLCYFNIPGFMNYDDFYPSNRCKYIHFDSKETSFFFTFNP